MNARREARAGCLAERETSVTVGGGLEPEVENEEGLDGACESM